MFKKLKLYEKLFRLFFLLKYYNISLKSKAYKLDNTTF